MKTLSEIYSRYSESRELAIGDKGTIHSYIPVYERLLAPYRTGGTILEIGVNQGHSIKMWAEYFNHTRIIGVDIWELSGDFIKGIPGCEFVFCDATDPSIVGKLGNVSLNVVIDDGSHMFDAQKKSFEILKPLVSKGGIYIIEDILSPESSVPEFLKFNPTPEIIDLRAVKHRFDDMMIVFHF